MPTAFVTGANRGIGLEFVRQYAADGWQVLAACRSPDRATALRALPGQIEIRRLDLADATTITTATDGAAPIDLLINAAGIMGQLDDGPGRVDYAEWHRVLETNTIGPVRVLDALADRLAASALRRAVTITSGMGSLADAGSGMAMMYRTSKAAVNMAMRARSFQLQPRGITTVVINPGWVRTDMGGAGATLSVEASVAAMRAVIDGLDLARTGSFLNYTGAPYAW